MTGLEREDLGFDPDFLVRIGETIRERRSVIHMTQEALAEQSGMHRTGIGKIERRENAPNVITLKRIAIALNMQAVDILGPAEAATSQGGSSWQQRTAKSDATEGGHSAVHRPNH